MPRRGLGCEATVGVPTRNALSTVGVPASAFRGVEGAGPADLVIPLVRGAPVPPPATATRCGTISPSSHASSSRPSSGGDPSPPCGCISQTAAAGRSGGTASWGSTPGPQFCTTPASRTTCVIRTFPATTPPRPNPYRSRKCRGDSRPTQRPLGGWREVPISYVGSRICAVPSAPTMTAAIAARITATTKTIANQL